MVLKNKNVYVNPTKKYTLNIEILKRLLRNKISAIDNLKSKLPKNKKTSLIPTPYGVRTNKKEKSVKTVDNIDEIIKFSFPSRINPIIKIKNKIIYEYK